MAVSKEVLKHQVFAPCFLRLACAEAVSRDTFITAPASSVKDLSMEAVGVMRITLRVQRLAKQCVKTRRRSNALRGKCFRSVERLVPALVTTKIN